MENTVDDLHLHVPLFDKIAQAAQPRWPGFTPLLTKNGGGVYLLLIGSLLGIQLWQSYIGAVVTYKNLPRATFGRLQAKLVPVYTILSSTLASALLGRWIIHRSHALDFGTLCSVVRALDWQHLVQAVQSIHVDAFQTLLLAKIGLSHFVNLVLVAPATTDAMYARHRLEAAEKKNYDDPTASEEMRKVNKKFSILHGISSVVDLCALTCTVLHALFVGYIGTNNL